MGSITYLTFGFLIGGVSIGIFLGLYYKKSYHHLLEEVHRLRELTFKMLETMEITGLIEWQRDNSGNIKGLEIQSRPESPGPKNDEDKNKTIH